MSMKRKFEGLDDLDDTAGAVDEFSSKTMCGDKIEEGSHGRQSEIKEQPARKKAKKRTQLYKVQEPYQAQDFGSSSSSSSTDDHSEPGEDAFRLNKVKMDEAMAVANAAQNDRRRGTEAQNSDAEEDEGLSEDIENDDGDEVSDDTDIGEDVAKEENLALH